MDCYFNICAEKQYYRPFNTFQQSAKSLPCFYSICTSILLVKHANKYSLAETRVSSSILMLFIYFSLMLYTTLKECCFTNTVLKILYSILFNKKPSEKDLTPSLSNHQQTPYAFISPKAELDGQTSSEQAQSGLGMEICIVKSIAPEI